MSSEEHLADTEKTDEQRVLEQERADEEREASFQISSIPANSVASGSGTSQIATGAATETVVSANTDLAAGETEETIPKPKGRKSGTRTSGEAVDSPSTINKKPRASTTAATPGAAPATTVVETEAPTQSTNVRLDRLRQALDRFLDLIDYKASATNISKSLPRVDKDIVDALRTQFVEQLKDAIKEENEKLIVENQLDVRLQELHRLTQEADKRYHDGLDRNSDLCKDVWRPDLDIETAISARAITDQELRVAALKKELADVQAQNDQIHQHLMTTVAQYDTLRSEAREALDALDSVCFSLPGPWLRCTKADPVLHRHPRSCNGIAACNRQSKVSKQHPTFRISSDRRWTTSCRTSARASSSLNLNLVISKIL
ncbi:hypothetical protein BCV70DRAFT_202828 [Testicularia cyperi]|uniref:Nnf1-domain-containing protein n=1 Tax=Testicularia cyperi TaxID=1882483 RepID=A0A317XGP3_9BASI|nr:hypothetical protein BCV70DRAFT_202828 [Testicularia cyperi]